MKKLLVLILSFLTILACQTNERDILVARLGIVEDHTDCYMDGVDSICERRFGLHYTIVNDTKDSVFLPIGYPYDFSTAYRINNQYLHLKLRLETVWTQENGCHVHENRYYYVNDTIYYYVFMTIRSEYAEGITWLRNASTYDVLSKLEQCYWISEKDSSLVGKNIPIIIYDNDTTGVNINPKPRKVQKKK